MDYLKSSVKDWETPDLIKAARILNNELYRRAKLRDSAVEALEDARGQAATVAWADREAEAG